MNKSFQKYLLPVSVLLIVVLIVCLSVYFVGKKKGTITMIPVTPKDADKSLTEAESDAVAQMALQLYQELKGIKLSFNEEVFRAYIAMNERLFVATANYFASQYGNGENLAQWLNDDYFFATSTRALKDSILLRLATYGIKVQ